MQRRFGLRYDTKLILWTLFFLQIFLIGVFWILQGKGTVNFSTSGDYNSVNSYNGRISDDFKVHFIRSEIKFGSSQEPDNENSRSKFPPASRGEGGGRQEGGSTSAQLSQGNAIEVKPISNFTQDFLILDQIDYETGKNLTCFLPGSVEANVFNTDNPPESCRCRPEWHGRDCGQPEVFWRAFMTSKVPLKVNEARQSPHKVFYMITGNFVSQELLEVQIMELANSVDYFIICHKVSTTSELKSSPSETKRLNLNFASKFLNRIFVLDSRHLHHSCVPKIIYKEFKYKLDSRSVDPNDIFIISQDDEILNYRAVKYLKYYYDNLTGLIRFRLKWNVYGFHWQHPESTKLGSAACSIRQLEENYKSDPERMLQARKPGLIVGDLNHFGGWFCQYCYQPDETVEYLKLVNQQVSDGLSIAGSSVVTSAAVFPRSSKNGLIDASYIQNLIANGLFVDGKLGLHKLYRYSDKYYAPEYVERNSWRYDNLLINLYLSFDDDLDNYDN